MFSRATDWKHVRAVLDRHLTAAAEELGVILESSAGSISFDAVSFHTKIKFLAKPSDGTVVTPEVAQKLAWDKAFRQYDGPLSFALNSMFGGVKKSDYGRKFKTMGDVFTLVEFHPNRSKFPFVGLRYDGKRFKFHPEIIKTLFPVPAPSTGLPATTTPVVPATSTEPADCVLAE